MTEATGTSGLTDEDLYLFNEGTHHALYQALGAHPMEGGTAFAVWAPDAERVSLIGDFNGWDPDADVMARKADSGCWEAFVPRARSGHRYKYRVVSRHGGYTVEKADPFAFQAEMPPATASVVADLAYEWGDGEWMAARERRQALDAPISVYEVHLGSWRHTTEGYSLGYRELAPRLAEHVKRLGFTHVELMPVMEHPYYGSWGYQVTGFFAPTSRFGGPVDLMAFVDHLHREGIGVILDWVPSHFATDEHGLGYFDGTHLFEHADPRQGTHPDWGSLVFNYGRREVRSFLLSSAAFWLDRYHIDGLRVDAVASMLYLDYSRKEGEWVPNEHGGRENLEAITLLRELNEVSYGRFPGVQTFAEESTAWPMVSRPTYLGGLGFGFKWDMGWMHDTLLYTSRDPSHRRWHHHELTFRAIYAFTENYLLPLSHDEVVHGKRSLLEKMPGDDWQKFANLRLLLGTMFGQPGKKLLFMGTELAMRREWNHDAELDWHLADEPRHAGIMQWISDLNAAYGSLAALHEQDCDPAGFEWLDPNDAEQSVLAFVRRGRDEQSQVAVVANFTPVPRSNYRIGVERDGLWREVLNSDSEHYGGTGWGNLGGMESTPVAYQGRPFSLNLTLPPLGIVFLAWSPSPRAAGG